MRFNYSQVIQAIQQERRNREQQFPLRNEQCQSLLFLHPQPTAKVLLLWHGFTGGPYQFALTAHALFQEGYNVLVPLLPGHGLAGHWTVCSPPPLPLHGRVYQEFALRWLKRSRTLGRKVVVGGVGSGATLAAWLGFTYGRLIDRLLLLSPYFSDSDRILDLFTQRQTTPQSPYRAWVIPKSAQSLRGYGGFSLSTLKPWLDLGAEIVNPGIGPQSPPLLLVTSESDRALERGTIATFLERVRRVQSQTWHLQFGSVLDLAHTLLWQPQENSYELQLIRGIKHYVNLNLSRLVSTSRG